MKFAYFCICLLITCSSCSSQTNYSNKTKLKLNDNLFVVKTDDGYDAIDAKNNFLFPLAYDEITPFKKQTFIFFKVKKEGRYGLIDYNGIEMIETDYDEIEPVENKKSGENILKMNVNGKWGVMFFPGNLVMLPFAYDEIGDFGDSDRLILVKKNDKYGYQDLRVGGRGNRDTRVEYDYLENYKTGGSKYEKNGTKGKIVLGKISNFLIEVPEGTEFKNEAPPKFVPSRVDRFQEGDKWGLINKRTKEIILPAVYQSLYNREIVDRVYYIANKDGKWGIIDNTGKVITPHKYKKIREFLRANRKNNGAFGTTYEDVFYATNQNDKQGLIDRNNKILIPFEYERVSYSRNTTYAVQKNNLWGFYDIKKQKLVHEPQWDKIEKPVNEATYVAEKNNLKALVDLDGNKITEPIYSLLGCKDRRYYFNNPQDSTWGIFSKDGFLCAPVFKHKISYWKPNYYSYYKWSKDSLGNNVEKGFIIDNLGNLKPVLNGKRWQGKYANLLAHKENEKVGIMNKSSGEVILKANYEAIKFAPPFTNKVMAKADGKWGILSLDEEWLAQNKYDNIEVFTDALSSWITQFAERRYQFTVNMDKHYGIINDKGEVLVEVAYDRGFTTFMLEEYRDYVVVYKDRKAGLCKYGLLKKPNEFFDKIYTASGKLWIEKAGKKAEATISNGNVISYKR